MTPSEEESVVHNIDAKEQFATINGKSELLSDTAATKWRSLTRRRLKMFGGVPVAYGGGMMPTPCPDWVMELFGIMEKIKRDLGREDKFNHVLLNQYNDGMGIGAHKDGPLYEDIVFVLNLGGPAAIKFFENEKDKDSRSWSVFLEERSLLIFSGDAYNNFYHEIEDTQEDVIDSTFLNIPLTRVNIGDVIKRNPRRLSLTVRTVKLVSSVDSFMETPEQKAEMIRREQAFYQSISEKV
uniref:Fe2OG dioxygenase domain-containing protein n=1 Tax=Arcella intermedia TaxID=1963864 RepID=A0A6B2LER7_9EUKA